jgi:uncharacterized protein
MMELNKIKMVYRQLGKTGIKISVLSFGTMRWISEESCYETIQKGIDAGMNYFDASSGYVGGMSEKWTADAIKNRRSEVYFSSKSNYGTILSESATRNAIENSLNKTGLEYLDFFQVWGLNSMENLKSALKKGGMIEGIQKAVNEGLVRYGPGFTFHGPPEVFKSAVDSGVFLSATVSYNLMNRNEEEQIKYAAGKGVGIFIMNPLAGGVLAMAADRKYEFLEGNGCGSWYGALRFLLANRNITSALIGMSMPDQVGKNLKALENCEDLDEHLRQDLTEKIDRLKWTEEGLCTGCKYCEVCPSNFRPSKLMQALRDYKIHGVREKDLKNWIYSAYVHDSAPEELLERCIECGQCQDNCPQKLKILDEIQRMKKVFCG